MAFFVMAGCDQPPLAPMSEAQVLPAVSSPARPLSTEGMRSLDGVLRQRLSKTNVPAMAAAVIVGDRVTAAGAVGVRKNGDATPVKLSDKFHLGSCAKSMTATLAAALVEEGRLRWDSTVAEVFPEMDIHPGFRRATLTHLLSHSAGCPATNFSTPLWRQLWASKESGTVQRRTLARATLQQRPDFRPGTSFRYSNAGFAIAGAMLEKVTGESWRRLMQRKIFQPLGMKSAGFRAPASVNTIDQPWGHQTNSTPVKPGPYADNPDALGPAGTIHCSILDWAKYVHYHLSGHPQPLLRSPASLARLHQMHNAPGNYALGWMVGNDAKKGRVLHHAGSNRWWYAKVWLAPERRSAVLVASNAGTPEANRLVSQTLGFLTLDL